MTQKEFTDGLTPMCKALGVKMNKFQQELFWEEYKHRDGRDFRAGCDQCGRMSSGKLPFPNVLSEAITAAMEMRLQKEKDDQEKDIHKRHQVNWTPEERLLANRAVFELTRQSRAGEKLDREKVRLAQLDDSKDEEVFKKYGREGERMPTPAQIFGNIGRGMKDE